MDVVAEKRQAIEIEKATKISLRPIVKINRRMLAAKVDSIPPKERGSFWTISTRTEPKQTKKHRITKEPCPYAKVFKLATVQLQINVDYENCVNAQRKREGKEADFQAKERTWGTRVGGSLIEHTPKGSTEKVYYLGIPSRKCLSVAYEDGEGNPIEGEQLESLKVGFFDSPSKSRQELDNEVIWRTYKLDSILTLMANHVIWQIID